MENLIIEKKEKVINISLPIALLYLASAISGLFPVKWWTIGAIPGTLPFWLYILGFVLLFPHIIRGSSVYHYERYIKYFIVYLLFLSLYGLLINDLRMWFFDVNAIILLFCSIYIFSFLVEHFPSILIKFIVFFWVVHLIGALYILYSVISTGRLSMFVYSEVARFGISSQPGFEDAWKITLAGRLTPFIAIYSIITPDIKKGLLLLSGVVINLFLILLTLTRTTLIAFSISVVIILGYMILTVGIKRYISKRKLASLAIVIILALIPLMILTLIFPQLFMGVANNIFSGIANLFDRLLSRGTTPNSLDTIQIRLDEMRYLINDLKPIEWIIGRGIGGTFNPSSIYPSTLDVSNYLGRGGTPFSHNNYLTILLKGGLILSTLVLIVFPRYLFVKLRYLSIKEIFLLLPCLAGVLSVLLTALVGGAVHYLTGMIPFGAMLGGIIYLQYAKYRTKNFH